MGPQGAVLAFEVNSPKAGMKIGVIAERKFMEANNREHVFYGFFTLPKQGWNTIRIATSDLHNPFGWPLDDWHKLSRLLLRSYYKEAGDEYTQDNMLDKGDVLAKARFKNLRWEGGEYVTRSKPYVKEIYVRPDSKE